MNKSDTIIGNMKALQQYRNNDILGHIKEKIDFLELKIKESGDVSPYYTGYYDYLDLCANLDTLYSVKSKYYKQLVYYVYCECSSVDERPRSCRDVCHSSLDSTINDYKENSIVREYELLKQIKEELFLKVNDKSNSDDLARLGENR